MTRLRILQKVFLLISCIFVSASAYASHMVGGDIIYRCLGNNNFEITIVLYQDCFNGLPTAIAEDNPAFYSIYTAGGNPTFVSGGSVPAESAEIVDPNFSNDCINNFPQTCLRKQTFRFTITLPPSTEGYYIIYQRCCRNASISNIVNPGNVGVTYYATIPPFSNGECPNNSPVFKSFPPQIICSNNPFSYDFSATDIDGDSLSYELGTAYAGGSTSNPKPFGNQIPPPPFTPVNYFPPYSAQTPMSALPPLQINPETGFMTGTPLIDGRFIVTVYVHEWRNGARINTISRDMQFVVTNCSKSVVANMPQLADFPNTYAIECDGYTVDFQNTSTGGFDYYWEFGVPGATSTAFEPSYTYPDTGTYEVKLVVNRNSTCADSITRLVKIYPEFHAGFTWSGKLCPGEEIQFHDTTFATYPPVISWQWDFGDGTGATIQNPTHVFDKPGGPKNITLISRSALGCVDTATAELPLSSFDLFAGNDTIVVKDYPFQLNGSGSQYYHWSPADYLSDPDIANPSVAFPDTGRYTYVLTGTTDQGCTGTDTINIQVVGQGIVFVPNAFSPNGDGLNDFIEPKIVGFTQINYFQVFNRWGQRVYESFNTNAPKWDGTFNKKKLEIGTYYWQINVTNVMGEKVTRSGDITLLR